MGQVQLSNDTEWSGSEFYVLVSTKSKEDLGSSDDKQLTFKGMSPLRKNNCERVQA